VQQVDPKKLEAIRRQWKDKPLLLNRDKDKPSEKEAPPDARYMSDRNIRVEKEQRAKDTNVVPKPGSPQPHEETPPREATQPKSPAKPPAKAPTKPLPKLGNLGIPFLSPKKSNSVAKRTENPSKRHDHSPASGGDQAILEKNLPVGSENLLNAQESIYYSFYARLYDAIGPIWQSRVRQVPRQRRIVPGEYRTVVDVILDESGIVQEVRKIQSSGIEEFDNAVEDAWKKVGRFPHPPDGLLDKEGRVHTGWTFSVDVGQGLGAMYLPPERNY
jgi:TonB family protein